MSRGNNLPFPKGETMWNGDSNQISASEYAHLEGQIFEIEDSRYGTNRRLKLRVVRNKGSARLAKGRGVRYGTTADWIGRKVRGYVDGTGRYGRPVDDALVTSVAQNDLFYVIEEGPALILASTLTTATTALAVGQSASWRTGGIVSKSGAGLFDLGIVNETAAVTTGITGNRRVLVHVGQGFADME